MPTSPNAMTTATIGSSPADVQRVDSHSAQIVGIPTDIRTWTVIALVLVIALLLRFSIAATLPLVEPTEGRYAEISREMALSGDWVTPRLWLNGENISFLGKPPLFFWSAALSIKCFGSNELAVRLPSVVATAALLILMYGVVGWYLGHRAATIALIITITCPLVFGAAGTVILDLHLTFFVVGALLAYLAFAMEHEPKTQRFWSIAVFVFLAGGFLTKGPVAILLFGLPVFLWTVVRRKWKLVGQHAWSVGAPVFIALVAPWFVLAELRNPGFLRYFFINENLLRYLRPEYGDLYGTGHQFPYGTAALMFFAACLPWSVVASWGLLKRRKSVIRIVWKDDISLFLFLGFASHVVFWCLARQLLATYLLPAVPLFAIWAAHAVVPEGVRSRDLFKLAAGAATLWATLVVAAGPVVLRDSTRSVLAEGAEIARQNHISGPMVFAGRTPYSAMFYSPGNVSVHPNQSVDTTLNEAIKTDMSSLLILHDSDVDRIPESLRKQLQPMASDEHWVFFVTPTP